MAIGQVMHVGCLLAFKLWRRTQLCNTEFEWQLPISTILAIVATPIGGKENNDVYTVKLTNTANKGYIAGFNNDAVANALYANAIVICL